MRLGFIQFAPVFGDKAANFEAVQKAMRGRKADLWVLPELFATGYQFRSKEEVQALAEPAVEGETARFLQTLCAGQGGFIAAGFAERGAGGVYNSAMLVGPAGLVGVYRKVHLFGDEKSWFLPGDLGFPVFDIGGVKVGMMVCFDWLFPEATRNLALAGAEVIAHPVNLVLPHCQDAMVTRCIENGVFAVTANRVGTEHRTQKSLTFTGQSQVVDPMGKRLVRVGEGFIGAQVIDIDITRARDKALTERNDRLADRRPEQYRSPLVS